MKELRIWKNNTQNAESCSSLVTDMVPGSWLAAQPMAERSRGVFGQKSQAQAEQDPRAELFSQPSSISPGSGSAQPSYTGPWVHPHSPSITHPPSLSCPPHPCCGHQLQHYISSVVFHFSLLQSLSLGAVLAAQKVGIWRAEEMEVSATAWKFFMDKCSMGTEA